MVLHRPTNLTPSCLFCQDESSDNQRCSKKPISKFDLPLNLRSHVRSCQSWLYWVSFVLGVMMQTFWCLFYSSITFGSKVKFITQKRAAAFELFAKNGWGQNLPFPPERVLNLNRFLHTLPGTLPPLGEGGSGTTPLPFGP